MEHVLTLIATTESLDEGIISDVRAALRALGADVGSPVILSPGRACDLAFDHLAPEQADAAIRQRMGTRPFDIVTQSAANRRKLLLVADMDSTMVTGETLDELADFAGIKDRIAAITARAMNGEIGFEAALKERIGLLEGLPVHALEETWQRVRYTGGARALVQTMKAHGAHAILVSGGFKFFTARVREELGFDADLANEFVFAEGRLKGVKEPILGRETKVSTLISVAGERQLSLAQTLAVGDGANDLDMIRAAGLGVAFHAKPVVASEAKVRIDHGDLLALLYAQGYRDADIVGQSPP